MEDPQPAVAEAPTADDASTTPDASFKAESALQPGASTTAPSSVRPSVSTRNPFNRLSREVVHSNYSLNNAGVNEADRSTGNLTTSTQATGTARPSAVARAPTIPRSTSAHSIATSIVGDLNGHHLVGSTTNLSIAGSSVADTTPAASRPISTVTTGGGGANARASVASSVDAGSGTGGGRTPAGMGATTTMTGRARRRRLSMESSPFRSILASPMKENAEAPPPPVEASKKRRKGKRKGMVDERRLIMFEDVIHRLREPGTGIELKDRNRLFKSYPQTFLGSELVDWLSHNCNLLGKDEGLKLAADLFDAGYVISIDLNDRFTPDNAIYVFQTSYLWTKAGYQIADMDYLTYLLRRSQKTTPKFLLSDREEYDMAVLKKAHRKQKETIRDKVKEQIDFFEALSKNERRLLNVQEFTFWKMQRPGALPEHLQLAVDSDVSKKCFTAEEMEAKLTDTELIGYMEKKLDVLESLMTLNRVKVSTASRNLVHRCDILRAFDPCLEPSLNAQNPFITDNEKMWDAVRKQPIKRDLMLWCTSLDDLLRDPLGIEYFARFLKTEFSLENLDFYQRCQLLASLPTYSEFQREATAIFEEFIQVGSPRELNITSGCRMVLIAQFTAVGLNKLGNTPMMVKASSPNLATVSTTGAGSDEPAPMPGTTPTTTTVTSPVLRAPPATSPGAASPAVTSPSSVATNDTGTTGGSKPSQSSANGGATNTMRRIEQVSSLTRLPYDIFWEAQEHIAHLMGKDSYQRFLNSKPIQEMLVAAGIPLEYAKVGNSSKKNLASSHMALNP
ncbi:Regulator of G-protein signaling 7 [Irineochytrium annulatum]|nr:Regulator of G-protein signaling 7 [Irineochytrium annulatum]